MKVVNIVLSILILILVIAGAVFSFMLFNKRTEMVESKGKMAEAIYQGALELDKNSGTKVSSNLSKNSLTKESVEDLDSSLEKFNDLAQKVVTERNALAESLVRAGQIADVKKLPKIEDIQAISTYSASTNQILSGISGTMNNRDKVIRSIASLGSKLGAPVNVSQLKEGNIGSLSQLTARINFYNAQQNAFKRSLKEIGTVSGAGVMGFGDKTYNTELNKVNSSVKTLKNNLNKANNNVSSLRNTITQKENIIKSKDGQIANLKKSISTRDTQINDLKIALGLDVKKETPNIWNAGSKEARMAVIGKVIEVNPKYGFVAIDLGADTIVLQPFGNKELKINPTIEKGMELIVARGDLSNKDSQFISKIKINKVDKEGSIAEPLDKNIDNIEVDDIVYIDEKSL